MTDAQTMRIAERLCTAMGYQWPCQWDRYSIKVSKEAVTKYWIELAEHAIDAYENERDPFVSPTRVEGDGDSFEGDLTGTV